MDIQLPQQAEGYFNQEAKALLLLLEHRNIQEEPVSPAVESSPSHVFISDSFSEDDIPEVNSVRSIDFFGNEVTWYFDTDKGIFGFSGQNYQRIEKMIKSLANKKELRNSLSEGFLKKSFFEWVEKQYKGEISISHNYVSYIKEKAENEIKEIKISIPISLLEIQNSFEIGGVTFEYYTRQFFDEYVNKILQKASSITPRLKENLKTFRRNYQGKVFASIVVEADSEKGLEIAKEKTENSLEILRFFSFSALDLEIPSYFGMMGHVNFPENHIFVFEDRFPSVEKSWVEKRDSNFKINNEYLHMVRENGLDIASKLLKKERLSDIEKMILNCIRIYSRGVSSNNYADKLIFSCVALETMLLLDSSEPVKHSVSYRMGFLYSSDIQKRREAINILRDAYKDRGKYIHHGRSDNLDINTLKKFQIVVWTTIKNLLMMEDRFSSKAELIKYLNDRIIA